MYNYFQIACIHDADTCLRIRGTLSRKYFAHFYIHHIYRSADLGIYIGLVHGFLGGTNTGTRSGELAGRGFNSCLGLQHLHFRTDIALPEILLAFVNTLLQFQVGFQACDLLACLLQLLRSKCIIEAHDQLSFAYILPGFNMDGTDNAAHTTW